jgi:hypothetical protein
MPTVNADGHPSMSRMHRPDPRLTADRQDKRSVVAIGSGEVDRWLFGTVEEAARMVGLTDAAVFDAAPLAGRCGGHESGARLGCRATGNRDHAILLLLARLGLRGGEVVAMTLEDLDWERGEIGSRRVAAPLHATPSGMHHGAGDAQAQDNPAIYPLAMPLLAGPGAISTVIVFSHGARGAGRRFALIAVIAATAVLLFPGMRLAAPASRLPGDAGMNVITRLVGIILAAIAVQMVFADARVLNQG